MIRSVHVPTLAFTTLLITAGSSTARADEHVLVLLDTTGSMTAPSVPGKSRFQVAKERLAAFLDTEPPARTKYALWFFEGSSYHPIFSFSDNKTAAQVKAAILSANTGGATPLASSVCAAVDELIHYLPNELHTKRIRMATDGLENNSAITDQCFGPWSATRYDRTLPEAGLQRDSWQWKVRNKACTGNASTLGPCTAGIPPSGLTIVVDIDHLFDFVPFTMSRAEEEGEEGEERFGPTTLALAPPNPVNEDAAFFGGISEETSGHYVGITPQTPPAEATPVPGDANLDGCVNMTDRALVVRDFGTPGNRTDFNRDGIVNIFDLQTVLQNFGRGCGVP